MGTTNHSMRHSMRHPISRPVARPITGESSGGGAPAPEPLLLDTYTGAAAAYSLRKLRTAYEGAAIRVRRSSDNAEQDIGFIENELDTASLLAFCGAGNGFRARWYDQTANARDLTQPTTTQQPLIVDAGSLITDGGMVAALSDGGRSEATVADFGTLAGLSGNIGFSIYCVAHRTGANNGSIYGWGNNSVALEAVGMLNGSGANLIAHAGGNSFFFTNPPSARVLHSQHKSPGAINATYSVFRNGADVAASGHSTATPNVRGLDPLFLWQWASFTGDRLAGYLQEFILFGSNTISNRSAIESNINSYWGVY